MNGSISFLPLADTSGTPVWSSVTVVLLLQGSTCCALNEAVLYSFNECLFQLLLPAAHWILFSGVNHFLFSDQQPLTSTGLAGSESLKLKHQQGILAYPNTLSVIALTDVPKKLKIKKPSLYLNTLTSHSHFGFDI